MTSSAPPIRRFGSAAADLDLDRFARAALAVAVVVSALLLYHLTRGTSFWVDDWNFVTGRRGDSLNTYLSPYQGHLSLVPIAIYRVLFTAFGIDSYTPYRTFVIALSLIVALVVFEYCRHRVGEFVAMLVAVSMLFLGPGWQDMMWAFQIAWLIAAAAGIAAFIALDRHTVRGDCGACILILLALCSTSAGVAFAIGFAVDVALSRRRWRDAWIPGIPLILYAIWLLHYHDSGIQLQFITLEPSNFAQTIAGSVSGLTGLSGVTLTGSGTSITYGGPLAALGLIFVLWRAVNGHFPGRAAAWLITLVAFSLLTTLGRPGESPLASRYIYLDCVIVALFAVELARAWRPAPTVALALGVVTLIAVVSNFGILRSFGNYLRLSGAQTDAALAVLDLDRGHVSPTTFAHVATYPFERLRAGSYFAAVDELGTPAYTIPQLRQADATAQSVADAQLLGDGDAALSAVAPNVARPSARSAATAPTIEASANGTVTHAGACARFVPVAALAPGESATVSVMVPPTPSAVSVTASTTPAEVGIRRFSPAFTALGTVRASGAGIVLVRHDDVSQAWQLQLQSLGAVRVCTLSAK
jgi:hypothetical protein